MAPTTTTKPFVFPLTVVIDQREKQPYTFEGISGDGGRPLIISTATRLLPSGDYTLDGYEGRVAVERKSVADAFGTIGQNRERFVRELERLSVFEFAAVVIEAEWSDVIMRPPKRSQLPPKVVYRSVVAWQQRYPRVHWWACPGRRFAEVHTFRILERFWKELQT